MQPPVFSNNALCLKRYTFCEIIMMVFLLYFFLFFITGEIIPVLKICHILFLNTFYSYIHQKHNTLLSKPCDIVCYMRYYKGQAMTLEMTLFHSPPPPIPHYLTVSHFCLLPFRWLLSL